MWWCRLVGFAKALRMIVTGEPISAKEAHERGADDACFPLAPPLQARQGLTDRCGGGGGWVSGLVDEVISSSKSAQGQPTDLVVEAALAYTHQRLKVRQEG